MLFYNKLGNNGGGGGTGAVDDVQINGTSIVDEGVANIANANGTRAGVMKINGDYATALTSGTLTAVAKSVSDYSSLSDSGFISKGTLENIKNVYVRAVKAPYTTITATDSTYTLTNNAVYGQIPSQAVVYTLPTVVAGEDNWTKLFIDTTTTTSISFSSTETINPNGISDIQSGHKYIVICQYNNLKAEWEIYIIDGGAIE